MTRADDYEFDPGAVKDVADVFERNEMEPNEEASIRDNSNMLYELGTVCNSHGVMGSNERVELIVAGADYHAERTKQQMLSDLREMLEAMSQIWSALESNE